MASERQTARGARASPLDIEGLRSVKVFAGLDERDLRRVLAVSELHHVAPKTQLVVDLALSQRVVFVLEGACRLLLLSPRGTSITLHDLAKGDGVGLAAAMHGHDVGYHAPRLIFEKAAILIAIETKQFRMLVDAMPALCMATCRAVCETLSVLSCRFYELATLDVRGRLLGELTRIAARAELVDGELVVHAAPTHFELAEKVGSAREAVTRNLRTLEREQIIKVGRRRIVIKDADRLRQLEELSGGANA